MVDFSFDAEDAKEIALATLRKTSIWITFVIGLLLAGNDIVSFFSKLAAKTDFIPIWVWGIAFFILSSYLSFIFRED